MILSVKVGIRIDLTRDEDSEPMEREELTDILLEELESLVGEIDFESYNVDAVTVGLVK